MSDVAHIGKSMKNFESSPQFDGYSKVVITVSDEVEYSAGTDTGRTLTLDCPWGTQKIAEDILNGIRGFQYQPYTASDTELDPASELGDGVTIRDIYGGIYTRKTTFGSRFTASISAPSEEEIDHEYPYIAQSERKILRQQRNLASELRVQAGLISAEVTDRKSAVDELYAALSVQADEISAKVSETGGDYASFGWNLRSTWWEVVSKGVAVMKVDENGLTVNGTIRATDGYIGGFDIMKDYLSYNNQTWLGTNTRGAYIGTSGLQLGKNFRVDMEGNLYAESGTFAGSVYAKSIQYGDDYGTLSGSALTNFSVGGSQIASATISTAKLTDGINSSLGFADYANGVFNGWNTANALNVAKEKMKIDGHTLYLVTHIEGGKTTRYVSWI